MSWTNCERHRALVTLAQRGTFNAGGCMADRFKYNEKTQQIESVEPEGMKVISVLGICMQCECKPECYDGDPGTVPKYLSPECSK
jgi:hypothetical protein